MKIASGLLAVFLAAAATSSISYLKYERSIEPSASGGQHYAVVDESIWSHARADLSDLRLFSAQQEIPFALTIETGGTEVQQGMLQILQPGTLGAKTQFLLDMNDAPSYDSVQLQLATRNFVAHARVEGQDDLHGKNWVILGTTTLFDLSDEKLGRNTTLQIPLSAYKYLRVTIDGAVKPSDVTGATSGTTRAEKAVWRLVNTQITQEQAKKDTAFSFSLPEHVPVERVSFVIASPGPDFRREVEIQTDQDQPVYAGELTRIHTRRNGQRIDVDDTTISLHIVGPGKFRVIVHNGDDVPLKITGSQLQQYERRIYCNIDANAPAQLFYGDEKLDAPVYDYRKLFQKDSSAAQLVLGAETLNAAFTGRPDERPWSERHPALLWAAILCAVLILGVIAFRSIKSANV